MCVVIGDVISDELDLVPGSAESLGETLDP